MSEEIFFQDELIAMLRWQFDIGIDEALLNSPDVSSPFLGLDEILTPKNTNADLPKNMHVDVISGATALEAKKPASYQKNFKIDQLTRGTPPILAKVKSLTELQAGLTALDDCSLKHTASNLCFADGSPGARLMIVGEVPGRDEDRMGVPFVGNAGHLLDKMLASIGYDRSSTYMTNLLPWRPPGNRSPTPEEFNMLIPWLYRHVQLADPDCVLLLGGAAAKLVFGSQDGIMKLRGKWHDINFGDAVIRPTLASLHPAYLLRSPAQKRLAFDDLLMLANRLKLPSVDNKIG